MEALEADLPTSRAAERYAHSTVWRLSLLVADDTNRSATRPLAAASGGIVNSVTIDKPIPTQLT